MISKKILNLMILCFVFVINVYSQQSQTKSLKQKTDSIKLFYLTEAAVRTPILRQVVVSSQISGAASIKSKLKDEDFFEGRIAQAKTNVLITLPFASWGKNSLTGSFIFEHQQFLFTDLKISKFKSSDNIEEKDIFRNTFGLNIGFQRMDSLFGRNIIYIANINGLTGKKGTIQRINFLGAAIINLKQTKITSLSVGLALNIDKSINIPVFPIITYWSKLDNGLDININFPQQVTLRKQIDSKLTGAIGSSLSVSNSFFQTDQQMALPNDLNYTQLGLQNGIGLEYRLAKKIIIGVNAGIQTPLSSKAFEVGEKADKYYIKNKISSSPYVKISVSLLPIIRSVF